MTEKQIKPTQLLSEPIKRVNPSTGAPRDLRIELIPSDLIDTSVTSTIASTDISAGFSEETASTPLETVSPQTPVILSVKSQTVTFQSDGTSKVDIVLEIQDVEHAVEYEIRIAKSAGTI